MYMYDSGLSILNSFKDLADKIKQQPIDNNHWKREEELLKKRIEDRRKESISITMSAQKFHKAFSL